MSVLRFHSDDSIPANMGNIIQVPVDLASKQDLLSYLAKQLRFPSYFGYNWDALDECISDLSWLTLDRVVLWHGDIPLKNSVHDAAVYLQILHELTPSSAKCALQASFPQRLRKEVESLLNLENMNDREA